MDDKKLDEILSNMDVPKGDENAQKRAINLALAEFERENQKKSKKYSNIFQGFSILGRLKGNSNDNRRRDPMEAKIRKRLMYGGVMTAAALALFVAPVIMTQTQETVRTAGGDTKVATLNAVDFMVDGDSSNTPTPSAKPSSSGNNFGNISANMSSSISRPSLFSRKKDKHEIAPTLRSVDLAAPMAQSRMAASPMMAEDSMIAPMPAPDIIIDDSFKVEGKDKFEDFDVNPFKQVGDQPVSTFSVDVDTASYSFVRRQLQNGVLPQKDAVRIEEMINYFNYDYPLPETREQPFKPTVTVMDSPWAEGKKLMHIGIKGFDIEEAKPKSNLVFLLDVSGSMNAPDKLPLLVNSIKILVDNLNEDDTVSIVVYAGAAGAVLEPTQASEKSKIHAALDKLKAGGSTAGAAGINLAYQLAEENFDQDAVNRVILATDGDFNVGITNREELKDFVERKRKSGVFLSVFGFGQGNYNDHMMQTLAQNGNGVTAYIDTLSEARKVLVEEATSSLFPIAKDVKIQVEFNPKAVSEYRLVGYETRALKREDFNNDKVDAGDIGAGHKVTAIYEYVPVGSDAVSVDPLRYGNDEKKEAAVADKDAEIAFVKMRYKLPKESKSKLLSTSVTSENNVGDVYEANEDVAFSVAVAGFAQNLKGGKYTGELSYDDIIELANDSKGDDEFGYRAEFVQLVRLAKNARGM
ncbi:MAG: VWA domain-containing protein [Pseudomonadota bacterium]